MVNGGMDVREIQSSSFYKNKVLHGIESKREN